MLNIIEAARSRWPSIPDDVEILETSKKSVTFAEMENQLFERQFPWMIRRPSYRALTVALEPIGAYWLGYNAKHNVLCVNFTGVPSAN